MQVKENFPSSNNELFVNVSKMVYFGRILAGSGFIHLWSSLIMQKIKSKFGTAETVGLMISREICVKCGPGDLLHICDLSAFGSSKL
jgi:hypothetical protein